VYCCMCVLLHVCIAAYVYCCLCFESAHTCKRTCVHVCVCVCVCACVCVCVCEREREREREFVCGRHCMRVYVCVHARVGSHEIES